MAYRPLRVPHRGRSGKNIAAKLSANPGSFRQTGRVPTVRQNKKHRSAIRRQPAGRNCLLEHTHWPYPLTGKLRSKLLRMKKQWTEPFFCGSIAQCIPSASTKNPAYAYRQGCLCIACSVMRHLILGHCLETLHADVDSPGSTIYYLLDRPQVGIINTRIHVVRMGNGSSRSWVFSAYFTGFCHNSSDK